MLSAISPPPVEVELGLFQVYPEQLLSRLAKKAFGMLGCEADGFYEGMGEFFLQGCSDRWAPGCVKLGEKVAFC